MVATIGQLNDAVDQTLTIIGDLQFGLTNTTTAHTDWLNRMIILDLVPEGTTVSSPGGGGGTIDEGLSDTIIQALTTVIEDETERIRTNMFNNILLINQRFAETQTHATNEANRILDDIDDLLLEQTVQLGTWIAEIEVAQDTIIEDITQNMQNLFIAQENRLNFAMDNNTGQIVNELKTTEDSILLALQNLDIDGGGGQVPLDLSEDLQPFLSLFTDMLSVLSDTNNTIAQLELDPTIENIINVNGSGSGGSDTGDETDTSTLPGQSIGVAIIEEIINQINTIIQGLGLNIGNASEIITNPDIKNMDDIQQFLNTLGDFGTGSPIVGMFARLITFMSMTIGLGGAISSPFLENITTLSRKTALNNLVPLTALLSADLRNIWDKLDLDERYKKLGFSGEDKALLLRQAQQQLQEGYLREAFLRDKKTPREFSDGMEALGYTLEDIPLIQELIMNVPPTQDAILFAVREVYNEQLAQELQLDSDYDLIKEQFEPLLKANGINPDFARLYWRSHWRLPSPTQFYQMLWRGLIDIDELDTALKVSDYSPQWRDKLRDIAYRTIPRVDIRRINKIGLRDGEWVKAQYMRAGWNEEDADLMTQFTLQNNQTVESEGEVLASVAQVRTAFRNGLVSVEDYRARLIASGLPEAEINLILENETIGKHADTLGDVSRDNRRRMINSLSGGYIDGTLPRQYVEDTFLTIGYSQDSLDSEMTSLDIERDIQLRKEQNDIILNRFLKYQITINEASQELATKGYTPDEQQAILQLWNVVREDRKTLPTKAEAQEFRDTGSIDDTQYRNILRGRGIIEDYINLY